MPFIHQATFFGHCYVDKTFNMKSHNVLTVVRQRATFFHRYRYVILL
jgi:hypothetical protein